MAAKKPDPHFQWPLRVPLVIPLGMGEMGAAVCGRPGRAIGLALGTVVGLPVMIVWLAFLPVVLVLNFWSR